MSTATPSRPSRRRKAGSRKQDPPAGPPQAQLAAQKRRAMSHPTRITIMRLLEEAGQPLSPSRITPLIPGAKLANVAYHTRELHTAGFLRLSKSTPRRGAVEHYYEPTAKWRRENPVRPGVVDVELCVLRKVVRDLAVKQGDKTRVQFTTDGDEMLLNLDGTRYRILPDCTIVEEHPDNGQKDGEDE